MKRRSRGGARAPADVHELRWVALAVVQVAQEDGGAFAVDELVVALVALDGAPSNDPFDLGKLKSMGALGLCGCTREVVKLPSMSAVPELRYHEVGVVGCNLQKGTRKGGLKIEPATPPFVKALVLMRSASKEGGRPHAGRRVEKWKHALGEACEGEDAE